MMTDPNDKTADDLKRAEAQAELDKLDQEAEELAARAKSLREKREAATAKATRAPQSPHELGLAARDAILNLLSHRSSESDATKPERDAWMALAQFLESLGN